jgi:alginate O-acetyltransferase complex protein AlgI
MLFNSFTFIFIFLPVTLAGFFAIGSRGHHRIAIAWLVGASLFFYGWWNPAYLGLILGSILFNYAIGVALGGYQQAGPGKWLLAFGVAGNLGLLGYFKYANFFVENIELLAGTDFHLGRIILPLAISFFTFQQIAYLVDAWKGETREYNFLHYCLFVTFFPQLIAGPIVHHKEMLPQFAKDWIYRLNYQQLAVGVTVFTIGLFKKVVLADGVAEYATPVFAAAEAGVVLEFHEAWIGALAYTFQLYFDFSGYSDMAIGLAGMFGIKLPLNFNSPYKANNIIEFWRCWHMTLSRFLRDYLYFPLGGNRKGKPRRYINLMITMLLGGLWHGAGWTFIMWGALHGFYLVVNHAWHGLRRLLNIAVGESTVAGRTVARLVTFIAVVIAWVFFRAESFSGAAQILSAMFGGNGFSLSASWTDGPRMLVTLLLLAWYAPNTQQIMVRYAPAFETCRGEVKAWRHVWLQWRPTLLLAVVTAVLFMVSVKTIITVPDSEFLYFNF